MRIECVLTRCHPGMIVPIRNLPVAHDIDSPQRAVWSVAKVDYLADKLSDAVLVLPVTTHDEQPGGDQLRS
jgi:hypothetical protein